TMRPPATGPRKPAPIAGPERKPPPTLAPPKPPPRIPPPLIPRCAKAEEPQRATAPTTAIERSRRIELPFINIVVPADAAPGQKYLHRFQSAGAFRAVQRT